MIDDGRFADPPAKSTTRRRQSTNVMALWFIGLFVIVLIVAIMSKSLLANVALIFVCILGYREALTMDQLELIRWGVAGMFVCIIGFSAVQMVTTVDKI